MRGEGKMGLGQKLLNLRKQKGLSQEEVAEKLNVTRQTVSKWETDQSTPDFDKIGPLCELYGISADELLLGKKSDDTINNEEVSTVDMQKNRSKKALGIGFGVILYFIAVVWIMISIPVLRINPIVGAAGFLVICGIATGIIIYVSMLYKVPKTEKEEHENKIIKQIDSVLSLITLIIYLLISFTTMMWAVTWIIWVVYGVVMEIIKLIFMLRGEEV